MYIISGAYALGVRNILTLTGDDPKLGDHPEASGIFDVDSKGLLCSRAVSNIHRCQLVG